MHYFFTPSPIILYILRICVDPNSRVRNKALAVKTTALARFSISFRCSKKWDRLMARIPQLHNYKRTRGYYNVKPLPSWRALHGGGERKYRGPGNPAAAALNHIICICYIYIQKTHIIPGCSIRLCVTSIEPFFIIIIIILHMQTFYTLARVAFCPRRFFYPSAFVCVCVCSPVTTSAPMLL